MDEIIKKLDEKSQSVTEFQSDAELQKMYHYDIPVSELGGKEIVQFIATTRPDIKTYGEKIFNQEKLRQMDSKFNYTSFVLSVSKPLDNIEGFSKTIKDHFLRYAKELEDGEYENSISQGYTRRYGVDDKGVFQVIDGYMVKRSEQEQKATFNSLTSEEIKEGQQMKKRNALVSIIQQLKVSLYDDQGRLYGSNLYGGGEADKQHKLNLLRYYEEQLNDLDNDLSNLNSGKKR